MIKSCQVVFLLDGEVVPHHEKIRTEVEWSEEECCFSFEFKEETRLSECFLDIEFSHSITSWRYLDYTWKKPDKERLVANTHSPKILKLESGKMVVATNTTGCWEYQPETGRLRWFFYHPMLSPTMVFDEDDQRTFLRSQVIKKGTIIRNGLLSGRGKVEEWARSPLGFVPVVCFTDHSDFDTSANLEIQRTFFSRLGIKVTKGFFLFDYTHKPENASFESEDSRRELLRWNQDGHELVYHALSQSYRGEQSEKEYRDFRSPEGLKPVNCYIDHGFHPYNYTKQKLGDWSDWYAHMYRKEIRIIWNYLDSGEGNLFTVNQLNPHGFTLNSMRESARFFSKIGIKRSTKSGLRNILMYCVSEEILRKSKFLKGSLLSLQARPSVRKFCNFAVEFVSFARSVIRSTRFKSIAGFGNEVFELGRFGPVFFNGCNQSESDIQVFQTLFVRDYDIVFSEEALDLLVKETGLMIAHTYFAFTGENHEGRLFQNGQGELRPEAAAGLGRLGKKIRDGKIWNPTLGGLFDYFRTLDKIKYIQKNGDILISDSFQGKKRFID